MDSSYLKYNVDMVFCIDATGSMGPVIRTVKQNALNFYKDVRNSMEMKQKSINTLRARLIIFRDYIADQEDAMLVDGLLTEASQKGTTILAVNGRVQSKRVTL